MGHLAPWQALQLAPPCGRPEDGLLVSCSRQTCTQPLAAGATERVAWGAAWNMAAWDTAVGELTHYENDALVLSDLSSDLRGEMAGTLGGFVNVEVMQIDRVSAGARVTWLTPDSPREDLLRLRIFAPGWGLRYTLRESAISLGVLASSRFVLLGEDWPMIDVVTPEARLELPLP